jgi:hypothetical protein
MDAAALRWRFRLVEKEYLARSQATVSRKPSGQIMGVELRHGEIRMRHLPAPAQTAS